jgi:hypothetical protein
MGRSVARKLLESHLVEGDLIPGREIAIRIDQTLTQLLEMKASSNISEPAVGFRLKLMGQDRWSLVPDEATESDQVVEHEGSAVLLVDAELSDALEDVEVDCIERPRDRSSWSSPEARNSDGSMLLRRGRREIEGRRPLTYTQRQNQILPVLEWALSGRDDRRDQAGDLQARRGVRDGRSRRRGRGAICPGAC